MHGMSDMEWASERKGNGKENGYEIMGLDGYGCMHGMSDMERASERKGDGEENGYETIGLMGKK